MVMVAATDVDDGLFGVLLSDFALTCGTSVPALKLLLSIVLGYPLAFLYRNTFHDKTADVQHVFFAACGIALCYFNYGFSVWHSLGCVAVVYLLLLFKGGTLLSVWIAYIYFLGYLLCGYYFTETDEYDITWTMPHCVLTLRVIGLVVDVYDGAKGEEQLSVSQKEVVLTKRPSLLEVFGYVYFFGGFMAGPQLPMKRYLKFTNGDLTKGGELPKSVAAGLTRGATAVCYLICFMIGSSYIPAEYVLSDDFRNGSVLTKYLLLGVWGKLIMAKYIICWMLAEGSCSVMGITYNGRDEYGVEQWNGCTNVHLWRFETSTQFKHMIESFNILTNKWAAHYVYKRLRFLGNKLISQAVTLFFLAIWHGLSLGYYICFALEFVCTKFESDTGRIIASYPALVSFLNNPLVKPVKLVLLRIYLLIFSGYCLIPFVMLSWARTHAAHAEVFYSGHFLFGGWLLLCPVVMPLLMKPSKQKAK